MNFTKEELETIRQALVFMIENMNKATQIDRCKILWKLVEKIITIKELK